MKPDIVITNQDQPATYIMDTKRKLLSEDKLNYGISQADMYQMYAYEKKYDAQHVTLIYPKTDLVQKEDIEFREADDGVVVRVRFVDLFDIHSSIESLCERSLLTN